MGLVSMLVLLGLYVVVFMFLIYVMICGNNKLHRDGCIGSCFRLLTITIPSKLRKCCGRSERNPDRSCMGPNGPCKYFIASFFATIYVGFIVCFMFCCYSNMKVIYPESYQIRQFFFFFVLPWSWVIFVMLQFMDPGEITATNVESYIKAYPYDNVIYKPKMCPTLKIPAPARSRYCKYSRKRIAKYDHYCPWVLAPIGERTHRYFIWFLIFNVIASLYLAFHEVAQLRWRLRESSRKIRWTDEKWKNAIISGLILLRHEPVVVANAVVLIVIAITLISFIGQQIYSISRNMTQIELEKVDDILYERESRGDDTKYEHAYNHGFLQNWKEFFCPPKIEQHAPYEMHDKEE